VVKLASEQLAASPIELMYCDMYHLFQINYLGPVYCYCTSDWVVVNLVASPPTITDECMYPTSSKHTLELPSLQDAGQEVKHARLTRNVALTIASRDSVLQVLHPTLPCLL
jgi:hypothetical protein